MINQGILPGLEGFFIEPAPKKPAAPWKPHPGRLAKFKNYFYGYVVNGRDIYARRKHIAERMGVSDRTVSRYIAYLVAEGWMETIRHTARTAIRKVLAVLNFSSDPVTPSGRPIEGKPQSTKVLRKTEAPVPLVILKTVYRRIRARYKPDRDTKRIRTWGDVPPVWEMPKPTDVELAEFLAGLGK